MIHLVDAVCVQASGRRSASKNHGDAIRLLYRTKEVDAPLRQALGNRLSDLLSIKGIAQYDATPITRSQSEDALKDMERAFRAAEAFATKSGWS